MIIRMFSQRAQSMQPICQVPIPPVPQLVNHTTMIVTSAPRLPAFFYEFSYRNKVGSVIDTTDRGSEACFVGSLLDQPGRKMREVLSVQACP